MKKTESRVRKAVGRLADWGKRPSPPITLVVASTCGCEMARLQRDICAHLNRRLRQRDGAFGAFDCEDIRCFAGHHPIREFILEAAPLGPADRLGLNDYEQVLGALAALGGVVLGGQAALDATRDLGNVFEVTLSKGGRFDRDRLTTCMNPDRCGPECMVSMISDCFLDWGKDPLRAGLEPRGRIAVPEFHIDEPSDEGALEEIEPHHDHGAVLERAGALLTRSWR